MRDFCTYFDCGYLDRGLALYESLLRHYPNSRLWVLCLDAICEKYLRESGLPGVVPVPLSELESRDVDVLGCKASRSKVEYYFTLTAPWMCYVLKHLEDDAVLTYVDADLYFMSGPDPMFADFGKHSIGIVGHRFPEKRRGLERYGIYNVGVILFRNDSQGRACAEDWRQQCISWCFARVEGGKYADQKYLDSWPERFRNVFVFRHKGVNAGPWNAKNHPIRRENGMTLIGDQPLICFHFHGVTRIAGSIYSCNLIQEGQVSSGELRELVYRPYVIHLHQVRRELAKSMITRPIWQKHNERRHKLRWLVGTLATVLTHDYVSADFGE